MVEKYKGIMPPGSIWYRFNREEALVLLVLQGELENISLEEIIAFNSADAQIPLEQIPEFEEILTDIGFRIITLHD